MRGYRYLLVAFVLLALVSSACATRGASGLEQTDSYVAEKEALLLGSPADDAGHLDEGAGERMIVRTSQLSLVVEDAEESLSQIKALVSEMDGYASDTRMWRQDEQLRASITVRVPSESLDEALAKFKALSSRVEGESSNSQDVTEEYTDLGARLRNLEATEEELLELLTTVRERMEKAEDILAVHREVTSIRGQIEQLKGRMQYLENTSSMAAVTIELIPDVLARPISVAGWQPSGTMANALRSLLRTLQFAADAGIWVVFYVLPVVGILVTPCAGVWLIWRRRRRKARSE
ncbi:MAG: DUF4349 domain-containing protein [Deltaproteobacteria bacterium]|nr:DUF4349 domain-containing protein [Deltaproteobacteria bacterium]